MRNNFAIDFMGPSSGFAYELIGRFGAVDVVTGFRPDQPADIVVVDCRHVGHDLDEDGARLTLAKGRTLGLLRMADADREALARITGRRFSRLTDHVFVHVRTTDPSVYLFTLVPGHVGKMTVDEAARYLRENVFTTLSGGNTPVSAGPPDYAFFPPEQLDEFCGSKISIFAGVQKTYPFTTNDTGLTTLRLVVNSDAYCYHDNGTGGGGKYHMVIVTTFTQVSPVETLDSEYVLAAYDFAYGLRVVPLRNGAPMTTGVQVSPPSPLVTSPRSDPNFGQIIQTGVGTGRGLWPINLDVLGIETGTTEPGSFPCSPYWEWTIGQADFPTIGQFSIEGQSTALSSEVRFATYPGQWGSMLARVAATPADSTPGMFAVANYLIFDGDPQASSYAVGIESTIETAVTTSNRDPRYGPQPSTQTSSDTSVVTIDLVAATDGKCPGCSSGSGA